eukprot:2853630-Amphidinium_carterae.1
MMTKIQGTGQLYRCLGQGAAYIRVLCEEVESGYLHIPDVYRLSLEEQQARHAVRSCRGIG